MYTHTHTHTYTHIHTQSLESFVNFVYIERIKLSRKVFYHFAIFAVVNKILITNKLKYYQLYRKIARDKNHLFSSHKVLRIFSGFFDTVFSHVGKNKKMQH